MNDNEITVEELQKLARSGKLRVRAFGEQHLFGDEGSFFSANIDRAVEALPDMIGTGFLNVYQDEEGLFVGPSNPRLVETDPFAEEGGAA